MKRFLLFLGLLTIFLWGCGRPALPEVQVTMGPTADWSDIMDGEVPVAAVTAESGVVPVAPTPAPSATPSPPPRPTTAVYTGTPTPDVPHLFENDEPTAVYAVRAGDTLGAIAAAHNRSVEEVAAANDLSVNAFLQVGQELLIPLEVELEGPTFKVIPDSELVYGPTVRAFAVDDFLRTYYPQSALLRYTETVEGRELDGPAVVELVAVRFSVNPRLLLAVIEHRAGWVGTGVPITADDPYVLGYVRAGYEDLYAQLSRAANRLNLGFYGRAEGGRSSLLVEGDNTRVAYAPTINHGTAAVQHWAAGHTGISYAQWLNEVGPNGFFATYERLFGNPFGYTYDPLMGADVTQPEMRLPWENGQTWYFTGGPHGGWAAGSAWAALDFAPDKDRRGCYLSEQWTTAVAAGTVVYSDFGGVLLDLDGDGDMGTGWVVVYWHVDRTDRIASGTAVAAGERLGRPSCEGGFSNGTHIHIARRYNGRWVSADGGRPFVMAGWRSAGLNREYDGLLLRDGVEKEACVCAEELNALTAGE